MYKQRAKKNKPGKRYLKVLADGEWKRPWEVIRDAKLDERNGYSYVNNLIKKGKLEVVRPGFLTRYKTLGVLVRLPGTPRPADHRVRVYRSKDG